MSTQIIVLDQDALSRQGMVKNLNELNAFQITELSNLNEAMAQLEAMVDFKGFIFIKIIDQLNSYTDKILSFRSKNPEACLLIYGPSINLDQLKKAMHICIDQVVIGSVHSAQLKEKIQSAERFRQQFSNTELTKPASNQFEAQVDTLADGFYRAALAGSLTESFKLPDITPTKDSILFIDCDLLRVINSVGIKTWLTWMKKLDENGFTKFEFENLGPGFLQLASFVENFIPNNGSVNSFYLHYWNEADDRKNFRFYFGKDFDNEKMTIPKSFEVIESGSKVLYNLDDAAAIILKFYKGKVQIG